MLKDICKLEHVVGQRVYHLLCDRDSPINEVKDALLEFLKFLGKIEDQAKEAAAKQAESESEKKEEEIPVVDAVVEAPSQHE